MLNIPSITHNEAATVYDTDIILVKLNMFKARIPKTVPIINNIVPGMQKNGNGRFCDINPIILPKTLIP